MRPVAALLAGLFFAAAGTAVVGERLAARNLREQVYERLRGSRDRAAAAVARHVDATRANLTGLAADPRTLTAFKRLRRATRELETDAVSAPTSIGPRRAMVRNYLRRYYAEELHHEALRLDSLLVPHSAAIFLQSVFFASDDVDRSSATSSQAKSLYEIENEIWQPIFETLVRRHGWQDLLLVDADDGRIVYSVSKTPVFQTSLIEGPYSESGLGRLFRDLREAGRGAAKWVDFAPFLPDHGRPASFAGAPVFDGTARVGVLVIEEHPSRFGEVVSSNGRWSDVGLGATGDVFVVGADSRMRSHPRFLDELRSVHPTVGRLGTTVSVFELDALPDSGEAKASPARYVSYRGASVLGMAKRLEIPELPWTIVAEIEEQHAFASLSELREALILVVSGVLVLSIAFVLPIIHRTRRPVTQILEALRAVRDGDSTVRVPRQAAAELDGLGQAVNELLEAHAEWVRQESEERHQRDAEMHDLVLVLKALARGDFTQRARVDGPLAGLANAVNAMGTSLGQLTDRLCGAPPRVAETAYAMQTVADQIVRDSERQAQELGSASLLATETLDWLRGCTIDVAGLVDAASRVEQMGQELQRQVTPDRGGHEEERADESRPPFDGTGADRNDRMTDVSARYQRLRATIYEGEKLHAAILGAIDISRRIRTAAEGLRGHVQTLQLLALDLHAQGNPGRGIGTNGGRELTRKGDEATARSTVVRA